MNKLFGFPKTNDGVAYENELEYRKALIQLLSIKDGGREDRTGTGTISDFFETLTFNISDGRIPLIASKFVSFKTIVHELIWMLSGSKSIKYLKDNNVKIWDNWLMDDTEVLNDDGKLIDGISSSIYGESWREWEDTRLIHLSQLGDLPEVDNEGYPNIKYELIGDAVVNNESRYIISREIDQVDRVIWLIKNNSNCRRILINAWNTARAIDVKLPPCHYSIQFYVKDGILSSLVNMRSSDVAIGLPYNIVQYATLTHLIAYMTGLKAGELNMVLGDYHLYKNLEKPISEQLSRFHNDVVKNIDNDPRLEIVDIPLDSNLKNLSIDNFKLTGYNHLDPIKMEISV